MDMNQFCGLTRTAQYETLKAVFPALAVGKSRAPKAELEALYTRGLAATPEPTRLRSPEELAALPAVEASGDVEAFLGGTTTGRFNSKEPNLGGRPQRDPVHLVVGPATGLGAVAVMEATKRAAAEGIVLLADPTPPQEPLVLPEVDLADLETRMLVSTRVNPELPEMPAPQAPPPELGGPLRYRFKEGEQGRPFTGREEGAWRRFAGGMQGFRENPGNSRARKWAQQAAVDLKVLGIEVDPAHLLELRVGAKVVRQHRREQSLARGI